MPEAGTPIDEQLEERPLLRYAAEAEAARPIPISIARELQNASISGLRVE